MNLLENLQKDKLSRYSNYKITGTNNSIPPYIVAAYSDAQSRGFIRPWVNRIILIYDKFLIVVSFR